MPLLQSLLFTDLLKLLKLLNHFFVHLRVIAVPSVSFRLPVQIQITHHIISYNIFLIIFGSDLPGSFCALFFRMPHSSTILTSSLSKGGCLKSFLTTIVPLLKLFVSLGCCSLFRLCSFSAVILSVPRDLLYIFWSIFLLRHQNII